MVNRDLVAFSLKVACASFSTVFFCWVQLSDIWNAYMGREIIAKQSNEFAFYHPSAVTFAIFLVDIPVIVSGILLFSIVVYFLGSLDYTAGKFFTYFCFASFNAVTFNQMYRVIASISPNFSSAIRYVEKYREYFRSFFLFLGTVSLYSQ